MARRRLLGDAFWAGVFALPTEELEVVRHCTLTPDDLALVAAKRSPHGRLAYALLLLTLRHPGRALEAAEVPPALMTAYVARQVDADPTALEVHRLRPQSRREYLAELMRQGGFRSFGRTEARAIVAWLTAIAGSRRTPAELATTLIEELRRRRILLPTPGVLEGLIHEARARAERVAHRALTDGLDVARLAELDGLIAAAPGGSPSRLAWLRGASVSPAAANLHGLVERLRAVRALGIERSREAAVPPIAFDALAGEGLRMTAQHLRDLAQPRRGATLAAAVLRLEAELTDAALLMFDKLMGTLSRRAEQGATEGAAGALRDAQAHLRLLARAGRAVIAAREGGTDAADAVEQAVGWAPFLRAVAEAEDLARPEAIDMRAELVGRWPTMRRFAPALLETFDFEGATGTAGLRKALAVLREMDAAGRRTLPDDAPTGFIRRAWRPFVIGGAGKPDRRAWEVCVLSELRDRLRAGDVWVRGSRRYRNFEDLLLPRPTFAALRAEGPLAVGVAEDIEAHLASRQEALEAAMAEVAALAGAGRLPDATLDEDGLHITPIRAEAPPEVKRFAADAYALLPRIRITDLLLEVDGWTGLSECFTHARSGRPAPDRAALLTAVLADGINLGLTRMAESCRGPALRQLAWTHDWHVREECYAAALARLIEAHRALPLAAAWGDGTTSSSDGQFFRAGGRGEAVGDVNARHGNEPGVAFYTHVSDQFGPFHTKVIAATASEAPHVLDGLLRHGTGLRFAEHYTDTGGATDQVFGLFALLGIRFAPRLRDLKDRRLYTFRGMAVPEAFSGMMGGTVDIEHLRAHWDEALRLAVSVGSGHVAASDVLRRLAAYPRQNGLAVALREVGRLERTLFTLDWLRSSDLRRRANAGLNKGEARNALARAVFFHRLGELRDRSFENQAYRASGLNLLVAAIILWNTRYLQASFDALRARGQAVTPDLVRHVAPLGWEHVGLTGDYVWAAEAQPTAGSLRPLRDRPSILAA
ncbi:Tn3 family transposase [Roseicella sp. DB1501]|uniref:Tn3 family transposase n=1 Tax=Roseicella sp. DB1501 TaxID=2730925 RepID=UPI0014919449|nr:Tn3 family transposase [Roseicella sp. DB1501]NOG74063.1 Tn3 family transposase [Roseicella sp. DB1501]